MGAPIVPQPCDERDGTTIHFQEQIIKEEEPNPKFEEVAMSPTSNEDHKCMDDISNNSSERNLSDEGQEGRDTMMYNSLVSPAKMPARGIDYNEEVKNAEYSYVILCREFIQVCGVA